MKKAEREAAGGTRGGLLRAAADVFAAKSFRDATVAEICARAGANVAAVNYYFGSKEQLYVEAWQQAFRQSLAAHPEDGGIPAGAPAEKRLRGRIRALLERIADPDNREFAIIQREMASPTGLLAAVIREALEPLRREMLALVRELAGEEIPEAQLHLCQMSVVSQCFHCLHRPPRSVPCGKDQGPAIPSCDLETVVDHIARFSLAGIRSVAGRDSKKSKVPTRTRK